MSTHTPVIKPAEPSPPAVRAQPESVSPQPATFDLRAFLDRYGKWTAIAACGLFIFIYFVLSLTAVRTKSPTYDEPLHAMAAWANLHLHDYRINFEDPPLWKYWATIPNTYRSIKFDPDDIAWVKMSDDVYRGWELANRTLFQDPTNDGAAFINHARFMMVLLGAGLGVVLVCWAWQLGGPIAAVIAAGLFALDPNLLGHGGMIKNDVPTALLITAAFYALWRAGQRLTILNALALSVVVAAAVNTKFSALLLAPMVVLVVAVRVALPIPWIVIGKELPKLLPRAIAAMALLVVVAIVSYVGIWASYGFRFAAIPDPNIKLNTLKYKLEAIKYTYQAAHPFPKSAPFDPRLELMSYANELMSQYNRAKSALEDATSGLQSDADLEESTADGIRSTLAEAKKAMIQYYEVYEQARIYVVPVPDDQAATDYMERRLNVCRLLYASTVKCAELEYNLRMIMYCEKVGDYAPDRFIAFLNYFEKNHLLPSAWLHGLLFVHARSQVRGSYLMGNSSTVGWWYYFPMAILFKTPVATLLALLASLGLGIWVAIRRHMQWLSFSWKLACVLIPFAVYMISAMGSNLNIGIRHILPAYPFMYLTAGVLFAIAIRRWGKAPIIAVSAIGVFLLLETLLAWPNYIAYFNFPFGGPRGGFGLLGDSNLDWGQDLPLLKKWQDQHPDVPLAFGPWTRSPTDGPSGSYFGTVDPKFYGIKADPYFFERDMNPPDLEQTHVLAISATYLQGVYGGPFTRFKETTPLEVLGGTIYLFDLRAPQNDKVTR